MVLSRGNCSGARYRRSTEMVRRSEADGILVVAYRGGPVRFETDAVRDAIHPGEIVFFDLRRAVIIDAPSPENISLIVSRRRLEALVPTLDAAAHGFVLRSGANRALLAAHLDSLHQVAGSVTAAQARAIGDATIWLVGGCLLEASRRAACPHAGGASLAQVKETIEQALEQPDFGPRVLMDALGISRASLYRMFEPLGGVHAYICERRLRHAMHVIADPGGARVRVKELAYKLGYSHASAFTRAFRKRFGVSPSEVRKRDAGAAGVHDKLWGPAPNAKPFLNADDC